MHSGTDEELRYLKESNRFFRELSKEYNLRANRAIKKETLEKYSDNWQEDRLRKLVIYNLTNLSIIVNEAIKRNMKALYIPNVFPLQKDEKHGYNLKPYENIILGIIAQVKDTELKLIWHPLNVEDINKMQ